MFPNPQVLSTRGYPGFLIKDYCKNNITFSYHFLNNTNGKGKCGYKIKNTKSHINTDETEKQSLISFQKIKRVSLFTKIPDGVWTKVKLRYPR
jgi:hypothetical protein